MKILVFLILLVVVVRFVIRRVLRQAAARWQVALKANAHRSVFVTQLRELAFGDPFGFMSTLCGSGGKAFVRQLWVEVGWKVARLRMPVARTEAEMDVQVFGFNDGRTIAVVCLPPTERSGETIFVGVVLPMNPSLKEDLQTAKTLVRFFYLNRYSLNRDTDLCGWTIKREQRTYNVGAPKYPQGFAGAVEAKLTELRQ